MQYLTLLYPTMVVITLAGLVGPLQCSTAAIKTFQANQNISKFLSINTRYIVELVDKKAPLLDCTMHISDNNSSEKKLNQVLFVCTVSIGLFITSFFSNKFFLKRFYHCNHLYAICYLALYSLYLELCSTKI